MAIPRPRNGVKTAETMTSTPSTCDISSQPDQGSFDEQPNTPTDDDTEETTGFEQKRKAGRPKGSRNRKAIAGSPEESNVVMSPEPPVPTEHSVVKRGVKRPKRKPSETSQTLLPPPPSSMIETLVTFIGKVQVKEEPRRLSREELIRVGTYIFDHLLSHAFSRPFVNQVPFDAYYYRSQIHKLMDLTTAEQKLWGGKYKKISDLYADIIQIMVNAVTFHRAGALIYEEARQMCDFFISELYPLVNECLFDEEPSPTIPQMPLPEEEYDESCFNQYNKRISDLYIIPITTVRENKKVLTGQALERLEIFCQPLLEIFTDEEIPPVNFNLSEKRRNFSRLYCTGGRDMLGSCIDDPYAVAVVMSDITFNKPTETMKCDVLVIKPFGPQHDLSTVDFPEINDARCWVRCAVINRLEIEVKIPWNYFGKSLPYSVIKLEENTISPQFYHDLIVALEFDDPSSARQAMYEKLQQLPQTPRIPNTPDDSLQESDDGEHEVTASESDQRVESDQESSEYEQTEKWEDSKAAEARFIESCTVKEKGDNNFEVEPLESEDKVDYEIDTEIDEDQDGICTQTLKEVETKFIMEEKEKVFDLEILQSPETSIFQATENEMMMELEVDKQYTEYLSIQKINEDSFSSEQEKIEIKAMEISSENPYAMEQREESIESDSKVQKNSMRQDSPCKPVMDNISQSEKSETELITGKVSALSLQSTPKPKSKLLLRRQLRPSTVRQKKQQQARVNIPVRANPQQPRRKQPLRASKLKTVPTNTPVMGSNLPKANPLKPLQKPTVKAIPKVDKKSKSPSTNQIKQETTLRKRKTRSDDPYLSVEETSGDEIPYPLSHIADPDMILEIDKYKYPKISKAFLQKMANKSVEIPPDEDMADRPEEEKLELTNEQSSNQATAKACETKSIWQSFKDVLLGWKRS